MPLKKSVVEGLNIDYKIFIFIEKDCELKVDYENFEVSFGNCRGMELLYIHQFLEVVLTPFFL